LIQHWDIEVDSTSECRLTLHQRAKWNWANIIL